MHFDAHVDTWPDNFGQRYAHGSVFYHAIKEGLVDPHRMIQIGIRSPVQRDVWDWTMGQGVTVADRTGGPRVRRGADGADGSAMRLAMRRSISASISTRSIPAFAPGTGTPEIGGLASWQAQAILRRLRGLRFVGMDVVEVAPAYDVAEITALAAATMAWEYLAAGRLHVAERLLAGVENA